MDAQDKRWATEFLVAGIGFLAMLLAIAAHVAGL
jgi:hypothetical protein